MEAKYVILQNWNLFLYIYVIKLLLEMILKQMQYSCLILYYFYRTYFDKVQNRGSIILQSDPIG